MKKGRIVSSLTWRKVRDKDLNSLNLNPETRAYNEDSDEFERKEERKNIPSLNVEEDYRQGPKFAKFESRDKPGQNCLARIDKEG